MGFFLFTHPASSKPKNLLYLISPFVDYAAVGGLSLLVFLGVAFFHDDIPAKGAAGVTLFLTWFLGWPHCVATSYWLYGSRKNVTRYPLTTLVVPGLLLWMTIFGVLSPTEIDPTLVKIYLLWLPYHYSSHTVNLTLFYTRRAGFLMGILERCALSGFVFGTFLLMILQGETSTGANSFYGITVPSLGLPLFITPVVAAGMVLCGVLFVVLAIRWCVLSQQVLPLIVFLPVLAQFIWFIVGAQLTYFLELIPVFHGLQSLAVTWVVQSGARGEEGGVPSEDFFQWWGWNIGIAAILFWLTPHFGRGFGYNIEFVQPLVIASIQMHHFFVDGIMWRIGRFQ